METANCQHLNVVLYFAGSMLRSMQRTRTFSLLTMQCLMQSCPSWVLYGRPSLPRAMVLHVLAECSRLCFAVQTVIFVVSILLNWRIILNICRATSS